mmetsp:Transcript_25576/g.101984  ORF Transcript_25576/g.101984 Transcript_25576/m.101984 type:complete len:148 (+) Transcript_25576:130-573(+)
MFSKSARIIFSLCAVAVALRPPEVPRAAILRHALPAALSTTTAALVGVAPSAVFARSSAELQLKSAASSGSSDLKGSLADFQGKLAADEKAAELQRLEDAKPLNQKIAESLKSAADPTTPKAPSRPPPGKATPRAKKKVERSIGDGL